MRNAGLEEAQARIRIAGRNINNFRYTDDTTLMAEGASLVAQMVKRPPTTRETCIQSLGQKIPWRKKWQPTPVLLPGKSHGPRTLVGYSPWGSKELDMTE